MKRTMFDIVYEILRTCKNPAGITRIMYQTNVSYSQVKEYVAVLVTKGLIQKDFNGLYRLTSYGLDFFEGLEALLILWHEKPLMVVQ